MTRSTETTCPAKHSDPKQEVIHASSTVAFLLQKAIAHHQGGQYPLAEAIYRRILQLSPGNSDALHLLGVIANQSGQYAMALELIAKSLQIDPRNRAALESYDKAIYLKPDFAEAYCDRANALLGLDRNREALESCDKAIRLEPAYAGAHFNRGNSLFRLHEYQAAVESYNEVVSLKPDYADAYSNRGGALHQLHQYQAAMESYDEAIRLNPHHAEAYNNRGTTLLELHQYQAARESYDEAILHQPNYAEAYVNRGNALHGLHQYQRALEDFEKAILLMPDYDYLHGMRLHMKLFLCDWENIESECHHLEAQISSDKRVAQPLITLFISGSSALQKRAAEIYVRDKHRLCSTAKEIPRLPRHRRIRIGYFSANFCEHPTSYLTAELFERHDRGKVEIIGFDFGPNLKDKMTERVSAAMDRFLDVRSMSNSGVAQLSQELEVDIAVDLMGFTTGNRAGIFAERAAPIQVNYLGYPGTMGASYMDYLIGDRTMIPESRQQYYSEKIVYLPDTFQANDSRQHISDKPFSRTEEGLPERGFVYCCFNKNCKITPRTFEIWMRILSRVDGSVLWLLGGNPQACANLRKEAEQRGISSQRLIYAKYLPLDEHIARQKLADLFLDTLPFNAGATASPALWAGLPVLTCMGEAFPSRMAASLLRALDLPELVTTTEADYEALAIAIATVPGRAKEIREKLRRNLLITPLFDLSAITSHIEAAYSTMYERYQMGLPPEHIYVEKTDVAGAPRIPFPEA
jgi:predicted O-linked N-acetylglucosamine transferase (SPINDLY family)